MKIVVLSDTHGNFNGFENVVQNNKDADLFLHLGDGALEYFKIKEIYKSTPMFMVKGNCDFYNLPKEKKFTFNGVSLFICHGDAFNVKQGLNEYVTFAKEKKFNIVAYGHTHKRFIQKEEDLCVFNPGSLTLPRTLGPSYAVLTIKDDGKFDVEIIDY